MDRTFRRLGDKWLIKWQFLKDVYFLLEHDIRFYSPKNGGRRYAFMSKHLKQNYSITLTTDQLYYLVSCVKKENTRK